MSEKEEVALKLLDEWAKTCSVYHETGRERCSRYLGKGETDLNTIKKITDMEELADIAADRVMEEREKRFNYLTTEEREMPEDMQLLQYILGIQCAKTKQDVFDILLEIKENAKQETASAIFAELDKAVKDESVNEIIFCSLDYDDIKAKYLSPQKKKEMEK